MELSFVERIRGRFPEGLTGIIAVGGTRTGYILQHNQAAEDPGRIDFQAYTQVTLRQYLDLVQMFFDLGGQHLVMPILSYQRFTAYDMDYIRYVSATALMLTQPDVIDFYHQYAIDPYFVGIDTLLKLSPDNPGHELGVKLTEFQAQWQFEAGRRRLFWEVAPIPLYSFWNAKNTLDPAALAAFDAEIEATHDLDLLYQTLYRLYARSAYGVEIPVPHFYLGTNRNGDLKLRSMIPIALLNGSDTRFYYTPYPSLFTTRDTLKAIIEEVAFGSTLSSKHAADYQARFSPEVVKAEYERVLALSADPMTTLGFVRQVDSED